MSYFLGIDLGTSYFAGVSPRGPLKGIRESVEKHSENGIGCELPVETFWKALRLCIKDALVQAGCQAEDILALSYSSQTNSFILLDSNDRPLTPLILWPDSRADEQSERLQTLVSKRISFTKLA